jgi:hypothetical protein
MSCCEGPADESKKDAANMINTDQDGSDARPLPEVESPEGSYLKSGACSVPPCVSSDHQLEPY